MKIKKCCRKTCENQNPQPIENFHKNAIRKDGRATACKSCRLKEANDYYYRNKSERLEYAKKAYKKDPLKFAEKNRRWREEGPEKKKEANRKSYNKWYSKKENRDKKAIYLKEHRDNIRAYHRKYYQEREKVDLSYRIGRRLRTRMNMALKKRYKSGSAVRDLGCSIEEFVKYVESFWEPKMSWNNYGNKKNQWSLDHTIPLSVFDLTNRKQFLKACHYTNIRPMWHIKNVKKGNKIP